MMVSAMDERLQPSYITVSYDDISDLANEDHTQAFLMSAKKFFEKLPELFNEEIEIKLPANFYAAYPDGGWIALKALLADAEDFLTCLYGMDDFEFVTHLKTASNQYLLSIYTDPALYTKKGMRSFLYDFTLTSWFIEEFSEDQGNKVIVAIKQNYSQYVGYEFCAYACLLIVELYDGETQQIMPLFDQLYAVSGEIGRVGISNAKDFCSYRLK